MIIFILSGEEGNLWGSQENFGDGKIEIWTSRCIQKGRKLIGILEHKCPVSTNLYILHQLKLTNRPHNDLKVQHNADVLMWICEKEDHHGNGCIQLYLPTLLVKGTWSLRGFLCNRRRLPPLDIRVLLPCQALFFFKLESLDVNLGAAETLVSASGC